MEASSNSRSTTPRAATKRAKPKLDEILLSHAEVPSQAGLDGGPETALLPPGGLTESPGAVRARVTRALKEAAASTEDLKPTFSRAQTSLAGPKQVPAARKHLRPQDRRQQQDNSK